MNIKKTLNKIIRKSHKILSWVRENTAIKCPSKDSMLTITVCGDTCCESSCWIELKEYPQYDVYILLAIPLKCFTKGFDWKEYFGELDREERDVKRRIEVARSADKEKEERKLLEELKIKYGEKTLDKPVKKG